MKHGYTIIELLVFLAIFSVVIVSFVTILLTMLSLQTSQSAAAAVSEESQFALQQLQYYVSSARLVDMPQDASSTTLVLRESVPSLDPTSIMASGSALYLRQGTSSAWAPLTSNKVSVSQFLVTRHYNLNTSSSAYGSDSVSFSFALSATSTNNAPYSNSFQSSATTFVPVGKIAMIQQAKNEINNPNVVSIPATYPTSNETSSLLLALVANSTSSASVAISDTAGNTWNLVAGTSSAYNTEMNLFAAFNARNSTNTVTATFGGGVTAGYASIFIYEYRGAAKLSSFDASSTQLQPNTQTPSSGFARPTSTVELVFGVTYNGNTSEIPSAGPGFAFETSSTVSHVFAEDSTQYITGPVAATWQYTQTTPSSSALIATFR